MDDNEGFSVKGHRKILFFTALLAVAAYSLDGAELAGVLITLGTVFGASNGVEHYSKRNG